MTTPGSGTRSGDIPPEQAVLLARIHQLAAAASGLRHADHTADPVSTPSTPVLEQLAAIDRDRDLTEITARANGVPASWVDLARRLGHTGRAWSDDQLLPTPRPVAVRRSIQRVLDDTGQLAEMAAITVIREHLLTAAGLTAEPDPVAAQQLRRNMQALWTRATATATSIRMGRTERAHAFQAAIGAVDAHVERYRHYSLDELDAQWRTHTTTAIADGVRRSLKSLRRTDRTTTPSSDAEIEKPPTPNALLDHAHRSLGTTNTDHTQAGAEIDAAVTDAMPDAATHGWDTSTDVRDSAATAVHAHPEAGPDP
ncbi:hypothetical protein ACIHDR_11735 [Nocardia sp. NPDC052278]|uniref:hypothetical protein n=1 Tax=unclassified Nocardia TaxID=2637762 RepID=UPI0036BDC686